VRDDRERTITQIEIPFRTIARVILVFVLLWLLGQVWHLMLLGIIALMFAAAIDPLVRKLERLGLRHGYAVATAMIGVTIILLGMILAVLSPVITEGQQFLTDLPSQVDRLQRPLRDNPQLFNRLRQAAENASTSSGFITGGITKVGLSVVNIISDTLIVIVFTTYILLDGDRIYRWCVRYVAPRYRRKLDRTIPDVSRVVSGYVTGQCITSGLFGIFAFVVLQSLHVPQPLFLALIAALGDAVPIVGVTAVTIPTVLIAYTVSPQTGVIVLAAYLIYQQLENYLLAPRIYHSTLNISSFAVLVSVLIGSALLGIVGALLALPIAAALPAVEDIWLEDHPLRKNIPTDDEPPPAIEISSDHPASMH
jgi:predicted PurR-regulated permease PerM